MPNPISRFGVFFPWVNGTVRACLLPSTWARDEDRIILSARRRVNLESFGKLRILSEAEWINYMNACAIFFDKPLSYRDGLLIQESVLEARIKDLIPDAVLFLEHLPVITCGVRSKPEQILISAGELKAKHIEISKSPRGGAVTFHGPGQLVMYPIIKLGGNKSCVARDKADPGFASGPAFSEASPKATFAEASVHGYLNNLEEVAIRTAECFGVRAYRRKGMTGAWTDKGKLAAIGVRFKRWVAYHGLSFNIDPDLSGFDTIIPCGLVGEKVTSLKLLLGNKCPSVEKARECLANHFSSVCARDLTVIHQKQFSASQLSELLDLLR